ncbi:MAG: sensor histidine kinase [Geminicoccaceae bacterium]
MITSAISLRLRLLVLLLLPLTVLALALGYWRYTEARHTAETLFDRSLLATALAISRDVAVSGGDALLPSTLDLMRDAASGEIFYHVTGPGGIYVTGYAYPPVSPNVGRPEPTPTEYFVAVYRDEPVRVVRIIEDIALDTAGASIVTVWQNMRDRNLFARQLALRAVGLMGVLLAALVFLVWFGVSLGLRPLSNLQQAIEARSPQDLSPIRRSVPPEVRGIVGTLNQLFGRVERSITAHQAFISDAAHQLRNPAAAVLSMAEATRDAASDDERKRRAGEVVDAARATSRIAEQLLSLDRLRQDGVDFKNECFELGALAREVCAPLAADALSAGLDFDLVGEPAPMVVTGDRLLLAESFKNLIENARLHGGPRLTKIRVEMARRDGFAEVTVADDGSGLSPDDEPLIFRRFGQKSPGSGSGLGLSIVKTVAERHGGGLRVNDVSSGASLTVSLALRNQ